MSHRVLLACLAVAFLGVGLLFFHQTGPKDSRAIEMAIEEGLIRLYGKVANEQAQGTNGSTFGVEAVTKSLREELGRHKYFPGFTKADDIWISKVEIAHGTTNLLCVIQPWKNVKYGVDGKGDWRKVSDAEYLNWPHTTLKSE
jgi:hypothetical protein